MNVKPKVIDATEADSRRYLAEMRRDLGSTLYREGDERYWEGYSTGFDAGYVKGLEAHGETDFEDGYYAGVIEASEDFAANLADAWAELAG